MLFQKKFLIGQELVRRELISQDDLDYALIEHERQGLKLGQILVKCGFISEEQLLEVLSGQLGLEVCKVLEMEISPELIKTVPASVAREYKLVPLRESGDSLVICMSEPFDQKELEEIRTRLKKPLTIMMDSDRNVLAAIKKYYGVTDKDDLAFLDDED